MMLSGTTRLAAVVGRPVRHSLSPLLHNAWIASLALDAAYVAIELESKRFAAFIEGLRGGSVAGVNVTVPFKTLALEIADASTPRARLAGAANILVFHTDGSILADNTDGLGLLSAFAKQTPDFDPKTGPVVILGAGGAARGAAAAFLEAGCPEVRLVNRTHTKALDVAASLGGVVRAYPADQVIAAFGDATAIINATSAGVTDSEIVAYPLGVTPPSAVIMDMGYRPLLTPLLLQAQALDRRTVDGLGMLIGQAAPAFAAFFGRDPPESVDVRRLALEVLGS
jgi:shikimate dehydrogenase